MHVLVIGASGFLGCKLVDNLSSNAKIGDKTITKMTLADEVAPTMPLEDAGFGVKTVKFDITDSTAVKDLIGSHPDVIFHLAGVMSHEAEEDFDKGYRVNVDGSRKLLDAIRLEQSYKPRLVYSSSFDVFGPQITDTIPDDRACTPVSSYGTQTAIVELLINDFTRKGYLNGIIIRLPTTLIRSYQPSKEESSFLSTIIRGPLANMEVVCPVPLSTRLSVGSPRSAVQNLVHAAMLASDEISGSFIITMPGLSVTVGEMIESLGRVTGKHATELIKHKPDELMQQIAVSWPREVDAKRALRLGFVTDKIFDDIIKAYIDDDLGGWKYHLPADMRLKPVTESNYQQRRNHGVAA